MSTISAIPLAEETDTLIQKKPQASLKFQAHMGAANASTKAKKIVGAVAARDGARGPRGPTPQVGPNWAPFTLTLDG